MTLDKTLGIVATAAFLVLVGGFVALALAGRPTETYVLFVSGPVVSGVVGVILSRKVKAVQQSTSVIEQHVNGLLTSRLDHVDQALGAAAVQADEIAARRARPPPPDT